jgi:orotidine-5'-phosphate decarboxylase
MTRANPICLALDTPDLDRAVALARALKRQVGMVKIGLEFFYAHGAKGYEAVAGQGLPIFLDLKLHDIPNTVASAMKSLMRLEPKPAIVNLHATGGRAMMQAAKEAIDHDVKLIAVTILTSLSNEDIWETGFARDRNSGAHAETLARLTMESGLDGVVCSPQEIARIKAATRRNFLCIVPGIRPADAATGDQKRIATPASALAAGADILVVGRPITAAPDPARAVSEILESLHAAG